MKNTLLIPANTKAGAYIIDANRAGKCSFILCRTIYIGVFHVSCDHSVIYHTSVPPMPTRGGEGGGGQEGKIPRARAFMGHAPNREEMVSY